MLDERLARPRRRSPGRRSARPPAGPPRAASRAKASAVSGVSSEAFSTAALPQSSAGKTFQATFAIGVFAAMIRPATPSGWRIVMAWRFGHRARWSCARRSAAPRRRRSSPARSRRRSRPRVLRRLAGLGRDDARRLVPRRARAAGRAGAGSRRARRRCARPRRAAPRPRRRPPRRRRPRPSARRCASTSPVAGASFSKVSPARGRPLLAVAISVRRVVRSRGTLMR